MNTTTTTNNNMNTEELYAEYLSSYATSAPTTTNVKLASEAQIKYYTDLCVQRSLVPDANASKLSSFEIRTKIEELKKIPYSLPMSEKQRSTILSVLERCPQINISVLKPKWEEMDVKEASVFIGELFTLERTHRSEQPISPAQVSKILRMYLCPDVIFTDTGWVETYEVHDGKRMLVIPPSSVIKEWIATNMSSADANAFISKYNVPYINWSKTRISAEQQQMIRTLEARCANIRTTSGAQEARTDEHGNVIQVEILSKKEWAPVGYNSLSDLEIYMLDKDSASKYIEQLQVVLADKDGIKFSPEPMHGDRLEALRTGDGDKGVDNDIESMANFIHGLFAQLGEELELEDIALAETKTTALTHDVIKRIRELIAHAITVGISFNAIDNLLDLVPNVRAELYAR